MNSDVVKAAIILGGSIVVAVCISVYFSPYYSCIRAFHSAGGHEEVAVAAKCAQLTSQ